MKPHRLLLDQMIDADVGAELQLHGLDMLRVADLGLSRADDDVVLRRAIADDRVLVTLDGDYGDWVVLPLSTHPGVLRLRTCPTTSANILRLLLPFLRQHRDRDLANHLVIIGRTGIRWVRTDRAMG